MPELSGVTYPVIQLPGMPDFNEEGQDVYVIEDVERWWNAAPPRAVLVPNGGAAGAVASGSWLRTEHYLNLSGWVIAPPQSQEAIREQILTAIPAESTVAINYLGRGWDIDKTVFVRLYDEPTFTKLRDRIKFLLPLVAPDPFKYALSPLAGGMGVFSGASWYEAFSLNTSVWNEQFVSSSGWGEQFSEIAPPGPYGPSLDLSSPGTATSRRLTYTITGPLTAGDWKLVQETASNRQLWANLSLVAGQSLTIDCQRERATFLGSTVPLFGDPHTLEPGGNTYRLISSTSNTVAFATVSAYPAYL